MIMTTGGFDYERAPFHFQDILYDCIYDLVCGYNNPISVSCQMSFWIYRWGWKIVWRASELDIYIPSSYFHFIGEFRSIFGLFGFGDVMDYHHVAAFTE